MPPHDASQLVLGKHLAPLLAHPLASLSERRRGAQGGLLAPEVHPTSLIPFHLFPTVYAAAPSQGGAPSSWLIRKGPGCLGLGKLSLLLVAASLWLSGVQLSLLPWMGSSLRVWQSHFISRSPISGKGASQFVE